VGARETFHAGVLTEQAEDASDEQVKLLALIESLANPELSNQERLERIARICTMLKSRTMLERTRLCGG